MDSKSFSCDGNMVTLTYKLLTSELDNFHACTQQNFRIIRLETKHIQN